MRQSIGLVATIALVLFGMVSVGGLVLSAGAQDATPPISGFEIAPGVTGEILPTSEDPPSLYRLHFAPDVTFPFSDDPSLGVVYVEAGTLTLRSNLPVTVAQLGATDAEGENIAAETEFTVTAGDYFVLPPFVAGEVRNDGDETATVSIAGIVPEEMATPTA